MTPQPGTAGTDDDPLDSIETDQLVVNGQTIDTLVGLAFDSADQTDGVLRFDGSGSTNGITDGSAKVLVNGTVHDVAGGEWVDFSGTSHSLDSWEKVVNSQFDVTITGTTGPVAPGNTLDVTVDVTNNGTDPDTQTVALDIDNGVGQVDSASVTLSGGGSTTQTLSWSVPSGQTEQDYQATVASADDSASQTVTVSSASLPSSAIYRWKLDDVGTGTATDSIGNADGTVNGVASVSGNFQGGSAGDGDGTDDHIDIPEPTDWTQNRLSGWGVGFTIDSYSGGGGDFPRVIGVGDSAFDNTAQVLINDAQADDAISARVQESDDDFFARGGANTVDDGNKHRVLVGINASGGSAALFIDNVGTSISITLDANPSGASSIGNGAALFTTTVGSGSFSGRLDGILDDIIIYNTLPDASLAQDDYDLQPWS